MQKGNQNCAVTSPENSQRIYTGKMKAFSLVIERNSATCHGKAMSFLDETVNYISGNLISKCIIVHLNLTGVLSNFMRPEGLLILFCSISTVHH